MVRRVVGAFAVAACAAALMVVAVAPASASASGPGTGTIGAGTGTGSGAPTPPPPGTPGKPPTGHHPAPPGGGRTGGPPPVPPSHEVSHFGTAWFPPKSLGTPPAAGSFHGCATSRWGAAEGASWSYVTRDRLDPDGSIASVVETGSLRDSCLYPPAWNDAWVQCAIRLAVRISRVTPDPADILHATQTTTWARTHAPADCAGSWTLHRDASVAVWGRYVANAVATVVGGTLRTWVGPDPRTGRVPPPRYVGGFSAPYTVNPDTAKGQLTCRGWTPNWSGAWTYTANDCPGGRAGGVITCKVAGAPTVVNTASGRHTGPGQESLQILDNGEPWSITWPKPRILGATKVFSTATTLMRVPGGSPWRTDADGQDLPNGPTQPIIAPFGEPRPGLISGPWVEYYLKASDYRQHTVTYLRYWEDADWPALTVSGLSIDFSDGSISATAREGSARGTGTCESDRMTMTVFRARTSN